MFTKTLSTLLVCSLASLASAHGVQTQITFDPAVGRIVTRSIVATSGNPFGLPSPPNSVTPQRSAYVEPLLYAPIAAGAGWYARASPALNAMGLPAHPTGPGPAWQYADQLAGTGWAYNGSTTLPNLQGTSFGYKLLDGLKQWSPGTMTFVDPGAEQAQLLSGDGTASFTPTATNNLTTGDAGPVGSLVLAAINSKSTNPHGSISVRLLGDGASPGVEPDDGIYLLKLALATTATIGNSGIPVGDSDPFYFLLNKNAAYADAVAALGTIGVAPAFIQGQAPEPTMLAAGLALVGVARLRRR